MKHILVLQAFAWFLVWIALCWYAGVDYMQRGFLPAWTIGSGILLAGMFYTFSRKS